MEQEKVFSLSPSFLSLAVGVALDNVVVFLAQMIIYGTYALIPSNETAAAGAITTVSSIIVWLLIIAGVWKKQYFFSLGIFLGFLMHLIANFPVIFGSGA